MNSDFHGSSVARNPRANGDMGWIPDLGRTYMPEPLSLCTTATKTMLQSPEGTTNEPMCHNH